MDSQRLDPDPERRRDELRAVATRTPRRIESTGPTRPVRIGANAWVSFDVCILPGVTIGRRCLVAAGAVVSKDVPDDTLVAGNPARVVRELVYPAGVTRAWYDG